MLCITGDFNLHIDDPTDTYGCQFNDLLSSFGLINHITLPTHQAGHTLDLVITQNNQEIELRSIKPRYFLSDHCFVCVEIIVAWPDVQRRKLSYCKFKSQYNSRLFSLPNKHAPVKSKILTVYPRVPWFSPTIKSLKRDRRKAERSWRSDIFNPVSCSKFQAAKIRYRYSLLAAKCSFFSDVIIEAEGDKKKLYLIIRSLTAVNSELPLPGHTSIQQLPGDFGQVSLKKDWGYKVELDIADHTYSPVSSSFNGHYFTKFRQLTEDEVRKLIMSSKSTMCELDPIPTSLLKGHISILLPLITKMVNLSLQTGVFPNEWKLALVTPLIKKPGLDTFLRNYRPISNLCFVSKISQWVVISQQNEHMEHNCSLPILSSAYRQGHSTQSALLKVHADILHNMEQQMITLLVLIDVSAAFDTVDHPILFQCLEKQYGFCDSVLSWHKSYLSDRKQCVILKGMFVEVDFLWNRTVDSLKTSFHLLL